MYDNKNTYQTYLKHCARQFFKQPQSAGKTEIKFKGDYSNDKVQ